eukprot:gnl/MRDRNA2_/MRDRNA2_32836_c0_seq1.p2 gnl/MRDRNA2_/MRDRNA2_32836_c0~~gnl/MRDRNA2_/MRDRNA2_32836_c0_seq1.p2  ORF type:complete len:239 (+),score=70.47 gnl/MRDRNA2_/MRDRNA2_32836_c0_seq1:73-789(+)
MTAPTENDTPNGAPEAKKPTEPQKPAEPKSKKAWDPSDVMAEVSRLMEEEKFGEAAICLDKALAEHPDDGCLKHNYAVVLNEMGKYDKAEMLFWEAFENEKKKDCINWATMWGLATVMTAQQNMPKLLQAEAILKDCIQHYHKQEDSDEAVINLYKCFVLLGKNLVKQKRDKEACEALQTTIQMGERLYGDQNHKAVLEHRKDLEEAGRRAGFRMLLHGSFWVVAAAVPIAFVYNMIM